MEMPIYSKPRPLKSGSLHPPVQSGQALPAIHVSEFSHVPSKIRRDKGLNVKGPRRRSKKMPWSEAEDAYLLSQLQDTQLITRGCFSRIANDLGTRTVVQCWYRYMYCLRPDLNHGPITPEEGAVIEDLVREIGHSWTQISKRLKGRTPNKVSNWYIGRSDRRKIFENNVFRVDLREIERRNAALCQREPVTSCEPDNIIPSQESLALTGPDDIPHGPSAYKVRRRYQARCGNGVADGRK